VNSTAVIDGYSAEEPIPDEDWEDEVRWALNYRERERKYHDRDGYFAEEAGSPQCEALGHTPDPENGWEGDAEHPYGWGGGDPICPDTRFGVACSQCEGDCSGIEDDVTQDAFWGLPGVRAV
jgi:hypothetical protein